MLESAVERHLIRRVGSSGWLCFKWVAPGVTGVPDRICIGPEGQVVFVELKTERGRVSPRQQYMIDRLRAHGCYVYVAYGVKGVDQVVDAITAPGGMLNGF